MSSSSRTLAKSIPRAFHVRHVHRSSAAMYPSILSNWPSHSSNQAMSEPSGHSNVYSSRPPVHRMKKFTPMQLTCNFQTTPPKPDAPVLLVMPQIMEAQPELESNVPYINSAGSQSPYTEMLISTPHGDTTHITSPLRLARTISSMSSH